MNVYALIWILSAVAGALLSLLLAAVRIRDLASLSGYANGRRTRARVWLIAHAIMLSVHVGFAYVGFSALDTPVRPESTTNILILLYGSVALIVVEVLSLYITQVGPSAQQAAETAASDLIVQAKAAAKIIEEAAERARRKIERDAHLTSRATDAAEQTALNTERGAIAAEQTAVNTDPER